MNKETGQIIEFAADEEIPEGWKPLPGSLAEKLKRMTPEQRLEWQRLQEAHERTKSAISTHTAASAPGDTPDDNRKAKNSRKRQRKQRRA